MLDALRRFLREHGYLTQKPIRTTNGVPSLYAYYQRFGGLLPAYQLIGYVPSPPGMAGTGQANDRSSQAD